MDESKSPEQGTTPTPTPVNTYEMPPTQPVEPVPAPAPAPEPVPEKKPSRVGKWLLWGLVVLLLAGLGALAYWQYTDAQNARSEATTLQNALKASQDANKAYEGVDESGIGDFAPTDKDRIMTATAAFANAPAISKDTKFTITIVKQGADFATASVGTAAEGAGYMVILKKVGTEWVVVFHGQNDPDKATISEYGIPKDYYEAAQ